MENKFIKFFIIYVISSAFLFSKGKLSLTGKIVDHNYISVSKAYVTLSENGIIIAEEKTNREGKFKFKKLSEGRYTLHASHDYYGSIKKELNLVERSDIGQIQLIKIKKAFKHEQRSSNNSNIDKNKSKPVIKFDLIGEIFSENNRNFQGKVELFTNNGVVKYKQEKVSRSFHLKEIEKNFYKLIITNQDDLIVYETIVHINNHIKMGSIKVL